MENLTNGDRFVQGYLVQKCPIYSKNKSLKYDVWKSKKAQKHFEELEKGWVENYDMNNITETMRNLIAEIDKRLNFRITERKRRFLDIGAATGGFSTYLLNSERFYNSGFGISLPVEKGGYEMLLEPPISYEFIYADIVDEFDSIYARLETNNKIFNLVLCDATLPSNIEDMKKRKELLDFQLKLGLSFLEPGGDLLIKLSSSAYAFNVSIMVLLNNIFLETFAVKPITAHKIRSSFYLYCSGFNKELYLKWFNLNRYGEDSIDTERIDVLNTKVLDVYAKNLIPIWKLQAEQLFEFRK